MKSRSVRDSNYELLRIVSMLFIVIWHVIQHGQVIEHTSGTIRLIFNVIMFIVIIHVNSFMLITGYFQSKSTFRLKKFLTYILEIFFYNFLITTLLKYLGLIKINYTEYIVSISFFNLNSYWYIRCFLIVYLLSPFINKFIDMSSRIELKRLIIIMLLCFSIFPFFTLNLFYDAGGGFTVAQYILMYFIGAYIRKYDLNIAFLSKYNLEQKRTIYLFSLVFFCVVNIMFYYFQRHLGTLDNELLEYISGRIDMFRYSYNSPLVIIQSISMFLLFGTFSFKNKFINFISSLTLGVYLIHENNYLKANIYRWMNIMTGNPIFGKSIILKVFVWSIIIFITCALIELIRKFIFYILSKVKFIKKITIKINDYINNLCKIH